MKPSLRDHIEDARRREALRKVVRDYPRLATHPLLQQYPVAEWLSTQERARLAFVAWRFQQGDE